MGLAFSPEAWGLIVVASCFGGWVLGNLTAAPTAETEGGAPDGASDGYADDTALVGEQNPLFSLRLTPVAAAKNTPNSHPIGRPAQEITAQRGAPTQHFSGQSELVLQEGPAATFRHSTGACAPRPQIQGATEAAALDLPNGVPQNIGPHYTGLTAGSLPLAEIRAHARHLLNTNNVWEAPETQEQLAEFMRTADRKSIDLLSHYRGSIEELQRTNDHEIRAERMHRRTQRSNPDTGRQRVAGATRHVQQFPDTDRVHPSRSPVRPSRDAEGRAQINQPRARSERPTR
jgi:hypothetical protein